MKKQTLTILFGGALLIGGLTACGSQMNSTTTPENVTEKRMNTLAYQATTSLATLKDHSSAKMMKKAAISETTKNKIEELLPSIDILLENDGVFQSEIVASDREDYQIKQVVSFQGLAMEKAEYTLFYNMVEEKQNVDIDEDDDDDDKDDRKDKDDEVETIKKFIGVAVLDDVELKFTCTMETETEGNEYEEEMKFVIETGVNSYVSVKQEIEKENNEYEEEYHYVVVENNQKTYEFSLENELENKETETEIKLTLDGTTYKFDVYQKNNETFVEVKVYGTNEKITYKKVISTNTETNEKTVTFVQVQ